MVVVEGLDRTDGNDYLKNMPDDLWTEHTKEIVNRYTAGEGHGLAFKEFCQLFYEGKLQTESMKTHATGQILLKSNARKY